MESKLFKQIEALNPWWNNKSFRYKVVNRNSYLKNLKENNRLIRILVGARRVGKTSILQALINSLLNNSVPSKQIIFLTSDLRGLNAEFIQSILIELAEVIDRRKKIYLIIDEIQDLENWQRSIKYLYDNFNIKIYLSGSSSLLLKPETSKLTGRFLLDEILPLNFREFIKFMLKADKSFKQKSKSNQLEEYLRTGGYPEYVLNKNVVTLNTTIESTLYRDLLSIYGIRNPKFLSDLLDYLADKVTSQVSPLRIGKDLNVNDDTARFYLSYLQDVYLIYPVLKLGNSNRISKGALPKYYFNDTGVLYQRSLKPKIGQLAENAVYLHLRRKLKEVEYKKIFYNEFNNVEVDFNVNRNENWEVKFRDAINEASILKYSDFDNLNVIVPDKNIIEFKNAYPEVNFVNLYDFLLSKDLIS